MAARPGAPVVPFIPQIGLVAAHRHRSEWVLERRGEWVLLQWGPDRPRGLARIENLAIWLHRMLRRERRAWVVREPYACLSCRGEGTLGYGTVCSMCGGTGSATSVDLVGIGME